MNVNRFFKIVLAILLIAIAVGSLYLSFSLLQRRTEFRILMPSLGRENSGDEYVTAILNCSLPVVPREVPVLSVVKRNYTDTEAKTIATEVFDMSGEPNVTMKEWSTGGTQLTITNGTQTLWLFNDGSIFYFLDFDEYTEHIKLPEFSEAKKTADEFVAKFLGKAKSCGLLPISSSMEIVFSKVDFSEWRGSPESVEPVEIAVTYSILYNGIPLVNEGDIAVMIGDNGKITQFHCLWKNVAFGNRILISISPEQAIENMGSHTSLGRSTAEIQNITINNIELGYFSSPPLMGVDELLPAYEIRFFVALKDGSGHDWGAYVSATDIPIPQ